MKLIYNYVILEKYDMKMWTKEDLNCDNHLFYCSETSYRTVEMLYEYCFEPYNYKAVHNLNNKGEEDYDLNDMCPLNKA